MADVRDNPLASLIRKCQSVKNMGIVKDATMLHVPSLKSQKRAINMINVKKLKCESHLRKSDNFLLTKTYCSSQSSSV